MNPRSGAAPLALVALAAVLALLAPVVAAVTRGASPRTGATVSEAPPDAALETLRELRAMASGQVGTSPAELRARLADPAIALALLAIAADAAHALRAEAIFALRFVDSDESVRSLMSVAEEEPSALGALAFDGLAAMSRELAIDYVRARVPGALRP